MDEQEIPAIITESPTYDPQDPEHVAQWVAAGRPNLEQLDADGNPWRPTIVLDLQPDGSYLRRPFTPPNPVAQLAQSLGGRDRAARAVIVDLKAAVAAELIAGGMSESDTFAAGSEFVGLCSLEIFAFERTGGNAVSAAKLIAAAKAANPSWWSTTIEAIFKAQLGLP